MSAWLIIYGSALTMDFAELIGVKQVIHCILSYRRDGNFVRLGGMQCSCHHPLVDEFTLCRAVISLLYMQICRIKLSM